MFSMKLGFLIKTCFACKSKDANGQDWYIYHEAFTKTEKSRSFTPETIRHTTTTIIIQIWAQVLQKA